MKWHIKFSASPWGGIPPAPGVRAPSPEHEANFWSKLTFHWVSPLIFTGFKRNLEQNDIWGVHPERAVQTLTERVRMVFWHHVDHGRKHPLFWSLYESFRFDFWMGGICSLCGIVLRVLTPFTLRYLIQFTAEAYTARIRNEPTSHITVGFVLAVLITAMQILQSLCVSQFLYRGEMVGGQSRAVLIDMIYDKVLVISNRAKAGLTQDCPVSMSENDTNEQHIKEKKPKTTRGAFEDGSLGWPNGRIVNLMSVDTHRVDVAFGHFHAIWTYPFGCLVALIGLSIHLTYSAVPGFGLLVVGTMVVTSAMKQLFVRRKRINNITDKRVSLMQEIIHSVRIIKCFAWEGPYLERVNELHSDEIQSLKAHFAVQDAIGALGLSIPIFAALLSFITFSLSGHEMEPGKIFSALALFYTLIFPLSQLPQIISQVTDASLSLQRIEQFLLEEEREENALFISDGNTALSFRDAWFTWEITPLAAQNQTCKNGNNNAQNVRAALDPSLTECERHDSNNNARSSIISQGPFELRALNISIKHGELVAVIGTIGSGKSSLLSAVAGEMRKTVGEVTISGSRSFCSQTPWIQNTTLEKNITFGKPMDRDWYNKVIDACALEPDFEVLPNGDQTEIGERGINLSGGQKQRISLARSIYTKTSLVLMDDPLSAVDATVGRYIFDKAILGLLGDKCRILATHQLWVLRRCHRIIWIKSGEIEIVEDFDHLMCHNLEFQNLMKQSFSDDTKKPPINSNKNQPAMKEDRMQSTPKKMALMQPEDRAESTIPWSVYRAYLHSSGSYLHVFLATTSLVLYHGTSLITRLWLSFWTSDKLHWSRAQYIAAYIGLGILGFVLFFLNSFIFSIIGSNGSNAMFASAMTRLLRAPTSFFDTTPIGRITNRFSRDVEVMDNDLSTPLRAYIRSLTGIISTFILIITFFHYFAAASVPLCLIYAGIALYYRNSARELKRTESILRSHVFAKFSEGLVGVACIRAYGLKEQFTKELRVAIDDMNSAYYVIFATQKWLSLRIDMIGNAFLFVLCILVLTSRFSIDPSINGLVLTAIFYSVQMLQLTLQQFNQAEIGMHSVERMHHYGTQIEEEAPLHVLPVRETWPEEGEIILDNVQMRYRKNLPLVLQNVSLHVRGGEHIGIVGRTGAGKSSVIGTLFRLIELSGGHITIDGLNISTMGLFDLRSRLAIIPQDPALFSGTVRSNLDPFNKKTDHELQFALQQAGLAPGNSSTNDPCNPRLPPVLALDSIVEDGGSNFSLGQRQLVALARALARDSQIILCDEATSSVDIETDHRIQRTMAKAFRGKTLLCIAHRLDTIIGYDRVCVLDAGRVVELDTPLALWKLGGIFRSMCDRSGIIVEDIKNAKDSRINPISMLL